MDHFSLIASTADICLKPWKYAVIGIGSINNVSFPSEENIELIIRIECRDRSGKRHPENDLELEIYRSGVDVNLMLGWCNQIARPILWQGQYSFWMDGHNGKRCPAPNDCANMEAFARRLRALFGEEEKI